MAEIVLWPALVCSHFLRQAVNLSTALPPMQMGDTLLTNATQGDTQAIKLCFLMCDLNFAFLECIIFHLRRRNPP